MTNKPKSKGRVIGYAIREVGEINLCTEHIYDSSETAQKLLDDFAKEKPLIEKLEGVRVVGALEIVRVEVVPV